MSAPLDRFGFEKDLGENMARNLAFGGAARPLGRNASSVACLVFVALLAGAFWAGALWIGEHLLRASSGF